jgi:uncharacterized membrane protein
VVSADDGFSHTGILMIRLAMIGCLFAACTGGETPTGIDTSTLSCPPESTLTYEDFGQAMIADNCLSCHAGKESPRLDSVDQIRANSSLILHEAVATTNMPESSNMVLEERQLLGEWLACGAP